MTTMNSLTRKLAYSVAILCIALVSTYDTVLTHVTAEGLVVDCSFGDYQLDDHSNEQNPICEWVIAHRGIGGLVEYKAAGVLLATLVLFGLSRTKYRWLVWVTLVAQLSLFWTVNFATVKPSSPDPHYNFEDRYAAAQMILDFYLEGEQQ